MLISFGALQLNNSFYKSLWEERRDWRDRALCSPIPPGVWLNRGEATSYTSHFENHRHGNFMQQTTFQTDLYFFGRNLRPTKSIFPVDYCAYGKQTLISSSKEVESDRVQPYPAIAKLFLLVWSSFYIGWHVRTHCLEPGDRNFNIY